jgi:hypothetical protein
MTEKNPDAVVAELVAAQDVSRLQTLASGADKALAKAARKGLHLLRTKGVAAQAPRPEAAPSPGLALADPPEAWSGVPDRRGVRLVALAIAAPMGGYDFIHIMLSDEKGLEEVALGRGGKRAFRDARRHFESSGLVVADIPVEYAVTLMQRAYQRTVALGRAVPEDYARVRRVLAGVAVASDDELARAYADIPAPPWSRELAQGLHDLRDLGAWVAPPDVLDHLGLRWEEIATSSLLVDAAQRLRARHDAVDQAVTRTFAGDGRERFAARLRDAVMIYAAAGDLAAAGRVKAQAERLAAADFDAPSDPFCRKLVEKVLPRGELESALGAPEASAGGKGGASATPGGLIVPG